LPDIVLTDTYNYAGEAISTSELKGKHVIIQFWDRYCSSCLKGLITLDTIQRSMVDQLFVVPVTTHSEAEVSQLWGENPHLNNLVLPSVVNDTVLHELFPHNFLPYLIWIEPNGKIKFMTNAAYLTNEYITKFVKGEAKNWTNFSIVAHYDFSEPLFSINASG